MDNENLNGNVHEPFLNNEDNQNDLQGNQNVNFGENNSHNASLFSNNEEEEIERQNMSFMEKVTEKELTDIMKDIAPSLFFISLMLFPLFYFPQYCDRNIYLSIYILIFIYIGFI